MSNPLYFNSVQENDELVILHSHHKCSRLLFNCNLFHIHNHRHVITRAYQTNSSSIMITTRMCDTRKRQATFLTNEAEHRLTIFHLGSLSNRTLGNLTMQDQ